MAQQEIMNYLCKKRQSTITELSFVLKINRTNVARACRKMEKSKEIKVQRVKEGSFIKHLIILK
jgi:DNA-binding MarR family transcriptional regulator